MQAQDAPSSVFGGVQMHDIVCTWGIGQFTKLLEGGHSEGGCHEMYYAKNQLSQK